MATQALSPASSGSLAAVGTAAKALVLAHPVGLSLVAGAALGAGAYWGINLVSSALKTVSAGLSTTLTVTAQGALAWYATYLTGAVAESWFSRGKAWGDGGPRETVRRILDSLDRDSILVDAREQIAELLNPKRV